jgi:hypothetical protein
MMIVRVCLLSRVFEYKNRIFAGGKNLCNYYYGCWSAANSFDGCCCECLLRFMTCPSVAIVNKRISSESTHCVIC